MFAWILEWTRATTDGKYCASSEAVSNVSFECLPADSLIDGEIVFIRCNTLEMCFILTFSDISVHLGYTRNILDKHALTTMERNSN